VVWGFGVVGLWFGVNVVVWWFGGLVVWWFGGLVVWWFGVVIWGFGVVGLGLVVGGLGVGSCLKVGMGVLRLGLRDWVWMLRIWGVRDEGVGQARWADA